MSSNARPDRLATTAPGGSVRFATDADDARIGRLTIVNPAKRNAIDVAMWRQLRSAAEALDATVPVLHAVVVCGEGGDFAAGADIEEFPRFRFETASLRDYHEQIVAPALHALLAVDVPLVAQIEGACVGGGLEIAACCDVRIAQADARFGVPIAKLGFPMAPDELAVVLQAAGRDLAMEFLLEARLIDAAEALRRGLVGRVVEDAAAEATATARRITALPAAVARANKRSARQWRRGQPTDAERAAHFGYASSAEHREGIGAFMARRAPKFKDDPP